MSIFRGRRVTRPLGYRRVPNPHNGMDGHLDMTFSEYHDVMSRRNAQYAGGLNPFSRQPKSPYPSMQSYNYAREQHNAARAKKQEAERPKTVEEEYG